jgi:hypothetical protein
MKKTSCRGFTKRLGATAAVPAAVSAAAPAQQPAANRQRRSSFTPGSGLKKLSENLYLLRTRAMCTWSAMAAAR